MDINNLPVLEEVSPPLAFVKSNKVYEEASAFCSYAHVFTCFCASTSLSTTGLIHIFSEHLLGNHYCVPGTVSDLSDSVLIQINEVFASIKLTVY